MARITVIGMSGTKVLEKVEASILSDTGKELVVGDRIRLSAAEKLFYRGEEVDAKCFHKEGQMYYVLVRDLDPMKRESLQDQHDGRVEYNDTPASVRPH